jgi:hypothetical protein
VFKIKRKKQKKKKTKKLKLEMQKSRSFKEINQIMRKTKTISLMRKIS